MILSRLVSKLISLTPSQFRVLSDKTVMGNLTDICQKLINLRSGVGGKIKEEELVTGSTSSLVSQLGSLCKQGDQEEEERISLTPSEVSPESQDFHRDFVMQEGRAGRKPLIQEIESVEKPQRKYEKRQNSFGMNLRKAFKTESCEKEKRDSTAEIKIRLEETWLTEIQSKKLK